MKSASLDDYRLLLYRLQDKYSLKKIQDHPFVHTLEEGGVPLFRLVFSMDKANSTNKILLSFHSVNSAYHGVVWFLRTYELYENVVLAPNYFVDKFGQTFLGEDADYMKFDQLRENIMREWKHNVGKVRTLDRVSDMPKSYHDINKALEEFNKICSKKGCKK